MDEKIGGIVGILACIAFLLLVILLPLSFSYVSYDEYAMKKNSITHTLDYSEVYEMDRYFWGVGKSPMTFPRNYQFVDFGGSQELSVFDKKGLEIILHSSFEYRIIKDDLTKLYREYGLGYADQIINNARAEIKNFVADSETGYDVEDYFNGKTYCPSGFTDPGMARHTNDGGHGDICRNDPAAIAVKDGQPMDIPTLNNYMIQNQGANVGWSCPGSCVKVDAAPWCQQASSSQPCRMVKTVTREDIRKAVNTMLTEKLRKFYVEVPDGKFQLRDVVLPLQTKQRYEEIAILAQRNLMKQFQEDSAKERAETQKMVIEIERETINIVKSTAAQVKAIHERAEAEAFTKRQKAIAEGYKKIFSELGITDGKDKMELVKLLAVHSGTRYIVGAGNDVVLNLT